MKCLHCGFTYDDEDVCPICGTPAPAEETAPEPSLPYFTPLRQPSPAPVAPKPRPATAPVREVSRPRQSKGFRVATLCVLSVIAAALIFSTVLQAVSVFRSPKHEKQQETSVAQTEAPVEEKSLTPEDWSDPAVGNAQSFRDSIVHKPGEAVDFGFGSVTLKSITVAKAASTFDSKQRQVAFTLEIKNNTKQKQVYEAPEMTLGNSDYDDEHYAFAEYSGKADEVFFTLDPGKTYTAVYYYNLPKGSDLMTASVFVYGGEGSFTATTAYAFLLNDIK